MSTTITIRQELAPPPINQLRLVQGISIWKRFLYFLFIGWWLGLVWIALAYAACLTIIGMPVAMWMLGAVPILTTLKGV